MKHELKMALLEWRAAHAADYAMQEAGMLGRGLPSAKKIGEIQTRVEEADVALLHAINEGIE